MKTPSALLGLAVVVAGVVAGVAFAQDERAKWEPYDEAVLESADRNVLLVVILRRGKDEGPLPALADERSLYDAVDMNLIPASLDVADEAEKKIATERFGQEAVSKAPLILLVPPRGDVRRFEPKGATNEKLKAAVAEAQKAVAPEVMGSADYSNSYRSWKAAKAALAEGDKPRARSELSSALTVQGFARVKRRARFFEEAKKLFDELMAPGRAQLASARKALEAKDYKTFWTLAFSLREDYRQTEVSEELAPLLAPLAKDKAALRAFQEVSVERDKPRTDAQRAAMDKVRTEALEALRAKVPASQVKDEDVTVVFWEPLASRDEKSSLHVAGYWLGRDRLVVLVWDRNAKKVVAREKAADNEPPSFVDFTAKDDASRAVLDLMRQFARWEGRPVVPTKLEVNEEGGVRVLYYDGWDSGCGHLSFGWADVDPKEKLVAMGPHVM